jgi:hypothetical protein
VWCAAGAQAQRVFQATRWRYDDDSCSPHPL